MKNMKNICIKLVLIIVTILGLTFMVMADKPTHADAGFHSSSGSSGGSSSSHRSSSSSSRYSSSKSGSSSKSSGIGALIFIVILIVIYCSDKKIRRNSIKSSYANITDNTKTVEEKIREIDPLFSAEAFMSYGKEVYVKLQNAWMQKNLEDIRPFESNELFEQHRMQLQSLIDAKQTNKMERICVKHTYLTSFAQDGDKEILKMVLKAGMLDYIIEDETGKVVQGSPTAVINMTYELTFMRKAGVKTKEGTDKTATTNCPNCGAPTKVTSSGKCEYCGSIITKGEHGWVLTKLEGSRD